MCSLRSNDLDKHLLINILLLFYTRYYMKFIYKVINKQGSRVYFSILQYTEILTTKNVDLFRKLEH